MNHRAEGSMGGEAAPRASEPASGYAGLPRDAQAEYRAILANASIGIAFTRDRKFFLCNPKFAEMFGWEPEELIGQPGMAVYPSRESYEALGAIAVPVLSAGRQLDLEWEVRRKDGSTFLARMIAKAIDPERPRQGTVWIVEDITESKRQADELARLAREQEAILNAASIGICFVRERRIVRCNRRFEEQHGYAPGELTGRPTLDLYASEQAWHQVGEAYAKLAAGQTWQGLAPARRRDGSTYWSRLTGCAVDPANPARGSVWLDEDITEQKRADEQLQRLLREQELILDNATVGIVFARERLIQRVNRRMEEMTGRSAAEMLGQSSAVLFADRADWERATRLAYEGTPPGGIHETEWRFRRRDGSTFLCRTRGRRIDAGEAGQQWIWSMEDVTAERDAEERVRRALAEQELIVENAQVGILFVKDHVIQRGNPRLCEMLGYAAEELAGMPVWTLHAEAARGRAEVTEVFARTPPGGTHTAEIVLRRKDGSTFVGRAVGRRVDAGEGAQQWIWILEDVTAEREMRERLERMVAERTQELVSANRRLQAEIHDRRQAEERAQHLADHDPLTGLPNRRLLEDRLAQAIARGDRTQKPTAVLFVDLDHFKAINDTLGHATGDLVLKEVAERLVRQLRVGDTVCRLGGDEFVVVLTEIARASDAAGVAQKILETVIQPCEVEDRELQISASIGISVFPDDGADAETLIRNADAAMYHAKETGRGGYQFFTEQMNVAAARRVAVETELRRALQENALRVHYQPIVAAASGETVAFEALLRWQHPTRGLLAPAEFLQVAEETGLTPRIGEWVLREVCRWIAFVGPERARAVSVNLSARQFADPRLAERVAAALRDSGVPPALLALEVSEATAMQHPDHAEATLAKLKELGVSLALDNFGSAFSNAARLRRFALDRIKLDRSLVAEVGAAKGSEPIVAAMVALGHALGLRVVAEGVETDAQREFLRSCACDGLQGFLLGHPREPQALAGASRPEDAARGPH